MAMTKVAAKALEKSIIHWEKNLAAKSPGDVKLSPYSCALCREFIIKDKDNGRCMRCPIMARTGKTGCEGTPYDDAHIAADLWFYSLHGGEDAFRAAARAEIEFLKSLREPVGEN